MDAIVQPGGPSLKGNGVLMSTSQLKPALDNQQNGASPTPSQTKGKKRERGDQSSDPFKRERSSKTDDSDCSSVRNENLLRSEVAKLTEKGSLIGFESVEKLIEFIQPNRVDKRLDLVSRSMIAGVIAATDRFDCLSHFVQLKGLAVLDEWLQDVHKGRMGEVSALKDGEKHIEEFLLVLLCALDKLPVNLHALQTCNIGRSVNRLRSHRNSDIQRKARSLVDIWKKRVELEMNVIDAKPGPKQVAAWPSKSNLPDVLHGGRNSAGSYDVSLKSSAAQQSESKTDLSKVSIGETPANFISSISGPAKSTLCASEESRRIIFPNNGPDVPVSGRDDKSSTSPLSHNSSHSFSGQEETRANTAGLTNANKSSGEGSRHRKSTNGVLAMLVSQKESLGRLSSISRNAVDEKLQPSTLTSEKTFEVPAVETSSNKLIVKIPNQIEPDCGSPAQSASGGSFDDPSVMSSRAPSPVQSDIRESIHNLKEKPETHQTNMAPEVNVEPWHGNNLKDLQVEYDDRREFPAAPDEVQSKNIDGNRKAYEKSEVQCSSSGNCLKGKQWCETSGSALNALIESCVKYSEGNALTCVGDDVGMNLLASVAAREMCASENVSFAESLHGNTYPDEENVFHDDSKFKPSSGDYHITDKCMNEKHIMSAPVLGSKEGILLSKQASMESCGDRKSHSALSEVVKKAIADSTKMDEKPDQIIESRVEDGVSDAKATVTGPSMTEVKISNVLSNAESEQHVETKPSNLLPMVYHKSDIAVDSNSTSPVEAKPHVITDGEPAESYVSKEGTDQKSGEAAKISVTGGFNQSEQKSDCIKRVMAAAEGESLLEGLGAGVSEKKGEHGKVRSEMFIEARSSASFHGSELQVVDGSRKLKRPKLSDSGGHKKDEVVGGPLSVSGPSDMVSRMDFDLNEGLSGPDGKGGEMGYSGCLPNANEIEPLLTPISLSCTSIPAAVTFSAAAKGSFVPPVDLLRNKGELGWKGSATTSAFRPVEPRKFPQLTTAHSSNLYTSDDCRSKPSRVVLDFDLNVADERLLEDMACQDSAENVKNHYNSGGLDLDLNRVDDTNNNVAHYSTSSSHKIPTPVVPVKSFLPAASLSTSEAKRDFDLNSGPDFDDMAGEQSTSSHLGGVGTLSMNPFLPVSGIRPYNLEARDISAWLPPGNSYSSVAIPSFLPDRGDHPFPVVAPIAPHRILGPSGGGPFTPDMYRGFLLSPSPAVVPYPSGPGPVPVPVPVPVPYQMVPFGTTPLLPSGNFSVGPGSTSGGRIYNPGLNSQYLGPVSEVSSQHLKPYMMGGLLEENSRKWSRQGFDLNAGPVGPDIEGRAYVSSGSQQIVSEEQGRIHSVADGVLKRKDPDAGLDRESFRYNKSSW